MPKITIVGAGNVGSQAAFYAALRKLGDIVLIDIVEDLAAGKALDILVSMPVAQSDVTIRGGSDYRMTRDSDIIAITAGMPRKPGMSRDDLIETNAQIMRAIISEVVRSSPRSILIIISNPLDTMTALAYRLSGFPKNRVIGMAGILDSARFRTFVALELGVPVSEIEAMVLGGHGDLMVPLISYCRVSGRPITSVLPSETIDAIVERVRGGGGEIVNLLKTGGAFFAPGVSTVEMIESILQDQKKILPCSTLLEGEYGFHDVFAGVPVTLGKNGVEEIRELELSPGEREAFAQSVESIRKSLI